MGRITSCLLLALVALACTKKEAATEPERPAEKATAEKPAEKERESQPGQGTDEESSSSRLIVNEIRLRRNGPSQVLLDAGNEDGVLIGRSWVGALPGCGAVGGALGSLR